MRANISPIAEEFTKMHTIHILHQIMMIILSLQINCSYKKRIKNELQCPEKYVHYH